MTEIQPPSAEPTEHTGSDELPPASPAVSHAEPAVAVAESTEPAITHDVAEPAAAEPAVLAGAPPIPDLSPAECAARLAALFPAVFTPGAPKPLKLRIQADVQQRAPGIFTRKSLSVFLHRHTTGNGYLKALANAPARIDLDGEPAGEVSDEHRQAAVAELDRRRALHEARRAAEREAQRAAYEQARRARAAEAQAAGPGAAEVGATGTQAPTHERPGPRGDGSRAPQARDARPPRPPRDDRRPPRPVIDQAQPQTQPRPEDRPPQQPRPARPAAEPAAVSRPPMDEAQRARATLLHAFETTTLTRANFCALKGWSDADLELALVEARREREQRGPMPRSNAAGPGAGVPREASREAPRHAPRRGAGPQGQGRRGPPGGPRPPR